MDMFSDLRLFAEAKAWAEEWERQKAVRPSMSASESKTPAGQAIVALVQKQAEWSEETKDFQAAADMYLQVSLHVPPWEQSKRNYCFSEQCLHCLPAA